MSVWRAKALECFPYLRSEIESVDSVGALWIDLIARFQSHYSSESTGELPEFIRAICLYANWCSASKSLGTKEAAWIEFYEYLPKAVLRGPADRCRGIVRDLVANLGLREVEKMGCSLKPSDLQIFLGAAREAEDERRRKSQKR
jgi:hypothetical protein